MGQSTSRTEDQATVQHPLDPLSADELRRAAAILREDKGFDDRWRFAAIELKEPPKAVLASGRGVPREALLICWNRDDGQAYKAVVSLDEDRVVSWEHRPGEQPNVTVDEYHECDAALRRDPKVVEALASRGVTEMDKVLFDVWAYGGSLIADKYRGRRIGWTDIWYRDHEDSNPYANPVNGLKLIVDLNSADLLEIEDTFSVEKPSIMGEYVPIARPRPQGARRPETARDRAARWELPSSLAATSLSGRSGPCASVSTTARGSCSTPSATKTAVEYGLWRTGCRSRRWSSHTGIRAPSTSGARPSTSASGASGS